MSHHGGHRRRQPRGASQTREADNFDRHEYNETPEQKLRKNIIHYGEVDPVQELPRLAAQIFEHVPANVPIVSEGFRIGVTEQPFKIPYYAALLRLLHDRPATEGASTSLGRQILEDFWKGFQAFLDKQAWRETRLCVQFFAHLTVARVISPPSLYELLKSFAAVFNEFSVSHTRASKAGLCIAEGLVIAGSVIKDDPALDISEIVNGLRTYIESTHEAKTLVQPITQLHSTKPSLEHAEEWLDCALAALQTLSASDFAQTADSVPQPYLESPPISDAAFDLPNVLVPPEVELDTESGGDAQVKKEEWPQCYIRLFDDDVTPDLTAPAGFMLRSNILDVVDIFEVNRKDCARLLLEYPKWTLPGTFKARPGAPPSPVVEGKNWDLDNTLIETILGACFVLPESTHKAIYYIALITELARSSPISIGPAVGKSIRKLYALLSDGLDVEVAHRFEEWFAVHMSNFSFSWPWKEWIPDLTLVSQHPKRVFMRRAIEYEIRLSYYDRILRIVPDDMAEPEAQVMPDQAPGAEFEYEEPGNPYYEPAQSVLNLLRGRAKPEDVMAHLEIVRNQLSETAEGDVNIDSLLRSIAVQSLLSIGSRSFSHFLNAIERYLPLLRNLAAGQISDNGPPHAEARTDIMSAVATVWRRSRHMILIVFDKLMQYQIVDPTDLVAWTFAHCPAVTSGQPKSTFNAFQWDLLKSALDKANGRVMVARRKVAALRREADDKAARAIAGESMEVDTEDKPDVVPAGESEQLTSALKASTVLTREQKSALARTLEGFAEFLAAESASPKVAEVITEHAWHNRANWEDDDWETWETWGWYRHWGRTYSPYLRNYIKTLEHLAASKVPVDQGDPVQTLFRRTWNIAVGHQEV
ncbi:cap binding protein 80-PB [Polyporus arcularius HHB13444]|uniref:Cap binding protein 80-PB n=1 Tax=Polyporus arcularius HHB13444 TaxID=1314778 RepID=A0A5C3P0T4_9APHY|nr:cap binding protein 80-PB [Polyporus arcularius HHB13444]